MGKMLQAKAVTHTLCEPAQSKCAVETHLDVSQEPFCVRIYRKNAGAHDRCPHCVRACAVEMHLDVSQEPLRLQEKCRRPAGAP